LTHLTNDELIHLRAMRLLVADLEKRRFGVNARPRRPAERVRKPQSAPSEPGQPPNPANPATAVRREVFERDAARCTFVDSSGQRCREMRGLELYHLLAFAHGGKHRPHNLTLRCRPHKTLAAEEDFGRELMEQKRALRHEPFRASELLGAASRR
jgi:hypothetical protein